MTYWTSTRTAGPALLPVSRATDRTTDRTTTASGTTGPAGVVLVCAEVPPYVVGGLGRYAERMIVELAGGDVPVTVLGAGPRARDDRRGAVTVRHLGALGPAPAGRGLRLVTRRLGYAARAAAAILRSPRGTVVAVHDWMGCPAGIVAALAGRRVVLHLHNSELPASGSVLGRLLGALETVQARLATAVIVPSSTTRAELVARGWPADRLRVVPHGCDDAELRYAAAAPPSEVEAVRARYPAGPLVVFAGRLADAKGVPVLLEAMTRLPQATLVLCGDGTPHTDEGDRTDAAIEELGLTGRVVALHRFLPAAELYAHYRAADVCVFPSRYEPFGLAAVEAMALGRPVVLGPGHPPELGPAPRCSGDDPDELARLLQEAISGRNPAEACHRHVTSTFRWERTAAETMRIYTEVA